MAVSILERINTPLADSNNRFTEVTSVAEDITSRYEADAKLRLCGRAIKAFTQGIVITDALQSDNPIVYASPSFERLTGYTSVEVLGRNCRFLQGPGTDREVMARLRQAIQDGQPFTADLINYRKDGMPFWNELSISPIHDDNGRVTHFAGTQTDVTERRRLERQLNQMQKLEAVGRLTGGIAHDFNNILTIINGYSELLLEQLSKDDPHADFAEQIKLAGDRAAALTHQLLEFSRGQILEPIVLDLNAVIMSLENMLTRLIGEDIDIAFELSTDRPAIKADRGQLEQVVLNLCLNACDAMPHGGKLAIETMCVELDLNDCATHSESRPGCYVLLAVSDSGCGIDKSALGQIFEPFFTTKTPDKGTGLGLATVFGIVKQSHGHIDVDSEPGLGTLFKVYFPIHSADAVAHPIPTSSNNSLREPILAQKVYLHLN